MRVQLVDPSAFTPPYDRALAAALARAGAEVELVTTKFLYGPVPEAEGYEVDERFYKRTAARGLSSSARLPFKARGAPARHARLQTRADGRRPRPLPVADPARDRPAAAAADPAAGDDRALHPAPERERPRRPRGAQGVRRDGRGRRPLRARGAAAARGGRAAGGAGAGDPARRLRLPDPACRRRSRCRRSCRGPRARSSSPSACCAPTRASRTCSRRSPRSRAPSCGSSATRGCRSSRCTRPPR